MRHLSFLIPTAVLLLSSLTSPASTVIIVDITDLSAVTVTAVAANSENDSSTTVANDGMTLWNFFGEDVTLLDAVTGNFEPTSLPGEFYDSMASDGFSTGGVSLVDLNLYQATAGASPFQEFSMTSPPFVGVATFNLSSVALSALPTFGQTGDVYAGFSGSPGPRLGQYIVVPEPSSLALGAFAGTVVLLRRRRSVGVSH